jgi:hypothetical protein
LHKLTQQHTTRWVRLIIGYPRLMDAKYIFVP